MGSINDIQAMMQTSQWRVDQAKTSRLNQRGLEASGLSGYQNPTTDDEKKMRDTANDFEAIFIKQLLDAMEKTIEREDTVMGGGQAESYFRDMMYDETAKSIARRPGGSSFGLGKSIYEQMAKMQPPDSSQPKISIGQTVKMGEEQAKLEVEPQQ